MTYENVTLRQYMDIQDTANDAMLTDEQKTKEYIEILYNIDINTVPLYELPTYIDGIKFLSQPIKETKTKKEYVLDDTIYVLTNKIDKLTAGQYLDFINISQHEPNAYHKILACVLIPKGHKYNDGYDVDKVYDDILDNLNILDTNSISFFLLKQLSNYTNRMLGSIIWQTVKDKTMNLKMKKQMIKSLSMVIRHMGALTI